MTADTPGKNRDTCVSPAGPDTPAGNDAPVSALDLAHDWRDNKAGRPHRWAILGLDNKLYVQKPWQEARAVVVLELHAEGYSIRQIAKETGINRETVRRTLRDWHMEPIKP
jgi:hypothetical protein